MEIKYETTVDSAAPLIPIFGIKTMFKHRLIGNEASQINGKTFVFFVISRIYRIIL